MSDTAPPPLASSKAQSAFGGVLGCGMIGGFLGAGLLAMLLPLPPRFEGFRDPLSVAMGVGSILFFAAIGMVAVTIGAGDEAKRLDRLFSHFGLRGASDPGHGRVYRGEHEGREVTVQAGTTGGSAFSRHSKCSVSVEAETGVRMLVGARGTPALNMATPASRKHVLLLDRVDIDLRSTHPELARALAAHEAWAAVERLLAGIGNAPGVLVIEPQMVQLVVVGEGATHFDIPEIDQVLADLRAVAQTLEGLGPVPHPARGTSWLALGHLTPSTKRWQQWAMSLGCVSVIGLGWLAWVLAVAVDAGLVPGL